MRINSLKTLNLLLSLSKDEAKLSGFFQQTARLQGLGAASFLGRADHGLLEICNREKRIQILCDPAIRAIIPAKHL
jgi:hypothetical protein